MVSHKTVYWAVISFQIRSKLFLLPPCNIDSRYIAVIYRTITHTAHQLLPISSCIFTGDLFQREMCKSCGARVAQARAASNHSPVVHFHIYSYLNPLPFIFKHWQVRFDVKLFFKWSTNPFLRTMPGTLIGAIMRNECNVLYTKNVLSAVYLGWTNILGAFIKHTTKRICMSYLQLNLLKVIRSLHFLLYSIFAFYLDKKIRTLLDDPLVYINLGFNIWIVYLPAPILAHIFVWYIWNIHEAVCFH